MEGSARSYSRYGTSFPEKVKGMVAKIDSDGKLITIVLVSLGIILVLFQAIK